MISEFILILKVSGSNPGHFEIILPNRKIPEKINCRDRDSYPRDRDGTRDSKKGRDLTGSGPGLRPGHSPDMNLLDFSLN